ncbi:hypothetical protein SAMN05421821_102249 [Mucilaginibacter lappiensis]|nr:hypothetical protein SAMN05421821_102249 [Mucilaginibacter lappiensis]
MKSVNHVNPLLKKTPRNRKRLACGYQPLIKNLF